MKLLSIISIFSLCLGSIKNNCVIRENGLNSIVINSSNLKEVTSDFGEVERGKEWQKSVELELFGNYRYHKVFKDQGIAFYAERKNGKKIINDIVLSEGCTCQTEKGIGIGSSYKKLSKVFGQPYFNNDKRKPSRHYEPNMYILQSNGEETLQIIFNNYHFTMSSTDTTKSTIRKIRIL